ncbi:MAG: putative baseplate assembly protein, partial [Blastocatellia bacterium]
YTSAPTATGGSSSLEVRVNNIKWNEVPTLFGYGPRERIYVTRSDSKGNVTVRFGDGETGARVAHGQENVTAKYRKGIGLAGLVQANQLSLLTIRPLGIKSVINPAAPTGAQDPQTMAAAQSNAPLSVQTLGRVVSQSDYEYFARNFSGIAKALATWTWNAHTRGIFLTVAGPDGAAVPDGSLLQSSLLSAIYSLGDPKAPVLIKSYQLALFGISASVKVDPAYLPDDVLANAESALIASFSFGSRDFGQPVSLGEVYSVIQNTPGVIAVDVTRLQRQSPSVIAVPAPVLALASSPISPLAVLAPVAVISTLLLASVPQPGTDAAAAKPAELLILDPAQPDIDLGVM